MKKKYYFFKIKNSTIGIIPLILIIALIGLVRLVDNNFLTELFSTFYNKSAVFLVLFLLYCALHEFFHSLAYILHKVPFKGITYGIALEKGVFYCLCKQNIDRNMILRSLLYPFFFLGVITLIVSLIWHLPMLSLLSIFNISGCSGDIIMFMYIIKLNKNVKFSEFDDPTSFAIYADYDVSKINHFGLEFIEAKNNIERNDLKKITISKASYVVIGICILLLVLYYFLGV